MQGTLSSGVMNGAGKYGWYDGIVYEVCVHNNNVTCSGKTHQSAKIGQIKLSFSSSMRNLKGRSSENRFCCKPSPSGTYTLYQMLFVQTLTL